MDERERGQVTPIMAVLLVVAAVVGLAVVALGSRAVDAAQAQTAADASALAGAAEGPTAARSVADSNHGTLVSFQQLGDDVLVTVAVRTARATARARATWPDDPVPGADAGGQAASPYTSGDGP